MEQSQDRNPDVDYALLTQSGFRRLINVSRLEIKLLR